jgi:proline iminopeptidase
MNSHPPFDPPGPYEGYVQVQDAQLYYREIGHGQPIIVLHGGPDFDHCYLLPHLDRLSTSFRLIYYDQRGRGKSAENVPPEQVSLISEINDLDAIREHFHLDAVTILGHSWGGLLAMEYATRFPHRVSHLILMNTAPVSRDDVAFFRQERSRTAASDLEQMRALSSMPHYQTGDIQADAEYYRLHFKATIRQPEQLEHVIQRLRMNVTPQDILKARAIEERLYDETWRLDEYDLAPRLSRLNIPTLIIHGDNDFVPAICAEHIAQAVPGARFVLLNNCGHFSYLECPDDVHREMIAFFENH